MSKSKLKTKRGTAKRFRLTAKGKFKFRRSERSHILTKHRQKVKLAKRAMGIIKDCDTESIKKQLGLS